MAMPVIEKAAEAAALILYRISTYYVLFFISSIVLVRQQHKWKNKTN